VVGLIGDVHYAGLDEVTGPELYLPTAQAREWGEQMWVALRAERNPLQLASSVRKRYAGSILSNRWQSCSPWISW
jgi:hypothetical protein